MKIEGSCHCKSITFAVQTSHPYPFNLCYCSICRKTQGGGGYAINLGADAPSLRISGEEFITVYKAKIESGVSEISPAERSFCRLCGSGLWVWDPRWPDLIHPFASAVDTDLPIPPERTHLMLGSAAPWIKIRTGDRDQCFAEYPKESISQWHERLDLIK